MEREPPTPAAEFWIAALGPVVSLGLGLSCLVAARLLVPSLSAADPWETLSGLGPLQTLLFWLGSINIMVGLFNLVPGFPLDGGRILRAVMWRASGDLHKATLSASTVGRAVGGIFVVMGIMMFFGVRIPFFGHGPVSGIWLAFIGWFLSSAAERSYRGLLVQDLLEGVRVAHLMRRSGYVVPPNTNVSALVKDWFMRSSEHAFPVVHDERLLGIVCVGDVRKVAADTWDRTLVTAIMTPASSLSSATLGEEASAAIRKLAQADVEQLPVLDQGRFVGMLERRDVARWLEIRLGSTPHLPTARPA